MMKKLTNKLETITPSLVIIFMYFQPFLDILATFILKNNLSNYVTTSIRIVFMLYMLIYILMIDYKEKKKIIIYLLMIITCICIHFLVIYLYKDAEFLFIEIKKTISTYYFIFILISFLVLYKNKTFDLKHLKNIFYIYVLFTFIPNILGIGANSYWHSKLGSTGWFYSANVLGSILILLLPTIIDEIKKQKKIDIFITSIIFIYVIFSIGTKTPVLGLFVLLGLNLLYYIYKIVKRKDKKKIYYIFSLLIVLMFIIFLILPKTSFYKNLNIHLNFIEKQGYKINSKEFIDNFIFSERLTKEENARKTYIESPLLQRFFGIGYIFNKEEEIIEIDYFDVFYREGIIGFILYFLPVIYISIKYFKNLKINEKTINTIGTITLILLLALFQGHIFITPAISIFIALILSNSLNNKEKIV